LRLTSNDAVAVIIAAAEAAADLRQLAVFVRGVGRVSRETRALTHFERA